MNIYNNFILVKGEDKTQNIESCQNVNGKYQIVYIGNPKIWSYSYSNVEWRRNPNKIDIKSVRISHNGILLFDVEQIIEFGTHWRIIFKNEKVSSYLKSNLKIEKNIVY